MRLFIAINFDDTLSDQLCGIIRQLKQHASGDFTARENLHLTLAYVGETEREQDVRAAMDAVPAAPFLLRLSGFGEFEREDGNICWIGVERNLPLMALQRALCEELSAARFPSDRRRFRAHLTLSRSVRWLDVFDREAFERALPPMEMPVVRINLMKSERVNGRLVYTPLYTRSLL